MYIVWYDIYLLKTLCCQRNNLSQALIIQLQDVFLKNMLMYPHMYCLECQLLSTPIMQI